MTRRPQFAQYQAPDNQQLEQAQQQQVQGLVQSGGSLNPQVVSQLKARSKQQALSMAEQAKQNAAQTLASKGFSPAGGTRQAANAQIDFGTINNILNANRDTDITAATTNRADNLNALQAATEFMNSRNARAGDTFLKQLAGTGAQADSDFRVDSFNEDQRRVDNTSDLQRYLASNQVLQAQDQSQFRDSAFAHEVGTNLRDFAERARQFNQQLGFGYNQLNQQADASLMDYLARVFGG